MALHSRWVASDLQFYDGTQIICKIPRTSTGDTTFEYGSSGIGIDVKFWGSTGSKYMLWDNSADKFNMSGTAGKTTTGSIAITTITVAGGIVTQCS